jgi:pimeloyl-ACP methyl ester carboxylesterase
LKAHNWDHGLWEFNQAPRVSGLSTRLNEIKLPVLVITGDDDRSVPTENSLRLARELPNAKLVVIPNCGHVPHEECPVEFMRAVAEFLSTIK